MSPSTIAKLCCPMDKSDLELKIMSRDTNGDIVEGLLTCPSCQRYYPIVYGVPIMQPDEYREQHLEKPILDRWGVQATLPSATSQ